MSNRAWVTLATNDSYGLGALVLAHSLRRAGSTYPAVVLITPSVTEPMRERLRAVFAEVITVDVLDSQDAAHLALLQRPELGITFTKIHCWNLTQYDKCVFLDADTLVVQNCDELFEREQLSAAPDVGWPDCFNSGVFVYVPSAETFSQLIKFAQERGSFDGGDQGLLNSFFSDWAHGDIKKHLPFLYNVTSAAFYSYLPALKQFGQNLKIIHFIGAAKPWLQQFNFQSGSVDAPEHIRGLLQLWWDIFVGQVHSQLDIGMVEVEESHDVPPALPPQDVRHQYHYQPTLDPESEFAWHHPDAQIQEEFREKEMDVTEFHDPWQVYRGHIPPNAEDGTSRYVELGRVENHEEIRKYAWDYHAQKPPSTYEEHNAYQDSQTHHTDHWQHYTQYERHDQHQHDSKYEKNYGEHHYDSQQNEQRFDQHQHDDQYNQTHYQHQHEVQCNENRDQHEHDQYKQNHDQHHYDGYCHQEHNHDWSSHDHHQHTHAHDHQHDHSRHTPHVESNTYIEVQKPAPTEHRHDHFESFIPHKHQPVLKEIPVHHVHVDKDKHSHHNQILDRTEICKEHGMMNGDISETESDDDEYITPRHPYDGFYLRHRVTVDARGRKVCSHEIPPTPSPSPPPDSPSPTNDFIPFPEDETVETINFEIQSGVAGNLARVMPGAAGQREALDELSRRQGWEAGNIDYMGADSFENIWAKISQTLSKPRTSPAKQTAPEQVVVQSGEVVQEPVAEQVEVTKEAVPVETAAPLETVPVPVAEVPVTVETVAPVVAPVPVQESAVEVPVPVEAVALATAPAPSVPAPVSTPSEVPVSVEAIVPDVPAPVEALAPVKAAAPVAPASPKIDAPKAPETVVAKPAEKTETPVAKPAEPPKAAPSKVAVAEAPKAAVSPPKPSPPVASDSPPLVSTPSKEPAPAVPAAKTEERRKPAGKLKLSPPAAADPLPTPDSELEDAAALASDIIARELRSPAVSSPPPAPAPAPPAPAPAPPAPSPPAAPQPARLAVAAPELPTPPLGAVSLAQIGVTPPLKAKTSAAALIESSVSESPPAPTDAPKKKVVKKVVKKEGAAAGEAPVPPPRKKEKKPKEK